MNVVAATLDQRGRGPMDAVMMNLQVSHAISSKWAKGTGDPSGDECQNLVTHALSAEGADASEDGTGRGTPLVVANCFNGYTGGADDNDAQGNHLVAFGWNKSASQTLATNEHTTEAIQSAPCSQPAVAFCERGREGGRQFESQEELAYAITNPGSGGRTDGRQIGGNFGVRRLTPRECERLQGFPEIENEVIIEICLDPHVNSADAVILNPKSPKSVGNAARIKSKVSAKSAVPSSAQNNPNNRKPVPLAVLINCGETEAEISSQGKSLSYANAAGRQSGYRLPIKVESFVPLIAGTSSVAEQIIRTGRADSAVNDHCSILQENGKPFVRLFGREITQLVSDACAASITREKATKSITFNPSQLSPSDLKLALCSVWAVIIGCIPERTLAETSCLRLQLKTQFGWTAYDSEGKQISDSARYRMLGNAVAVPVAEWIGRRIAQASGGQKA